MPTRWNSPGRWGQESPHRDRCTWRSRRPSPLHIHSPLCRSRPSALAQNECAPRFAVICVAGTYVLCRAGLAGHVVVRGVLLQAAASRRLLVRQAPWPRLVVGGPLRYRLPLLLGRVARRTRTASCYSRLPSTVSAVYQVDGIDSRRRLIHKRFQPIGFL